MYVVSLWWKATERHHFSKVSNIQPIVRMIVGKLKTPQRSRHKVSYSDVDPTKRKDLPTTTEDERVIKMGRNKKRQVKKILMINYL